MRRVELAEATGTLSDYLRGVRRSPVVITRRGRPVAAVVPMTSQEWEDYVVSHHAPLVASTRRARARFKADGGVAFEDVLAQYAHEIERSPRRPRRPARSQVPRVARRSRAK